MLQKEKNNNNKHDHDVRHPPAYLTAGLTACRPVSLSVCYFRCCFWAALQDFGLYVKVLCVCGKVATVCATACCQMHLQQRQQQRCGNNCNDVQHTTAKKMSLSEAVLINM